MASGPITLGQIDGEKVETVTDFIFLGSRITADSDYSHEIKRRLLLGRKVMTNLDSIFKSRDITLPIKVIVKAVADTMESEVCLTKTVFRERTLGITFCQYFITEHQELGLMRWSPEK